MLGIDKTPPLSTEEVEKKVSDVIRTGQGAASSLVIKELKRTLDSPAISTYAGQGLIYYIIAAGALAYAGRDVYADGIAKLLEAIDIESDPDILEAVHALHFKNHIVYINSIYYLKFVGMDVSIDNVLEVIKAMDVKPDALIAGYVIEYCKEYETNKEKLIDKGENLSPVNLEVYQRLSKGVMELADTLSTLVLNELDKGLKNKDLQENLTQEMMPYIGAVGALAFSGREMDAENISRMLVAIGVNPRDEYLDLISSLHFKNQLIYVIALYYLIIAEIEPNMDYLFKVIRAMDISPSALVAGYVIAYYKTKKFAEGLQLPKL